MSFITCRAESEGLRTPELHHCIITGNTLSPLPHEAWAASIPRTRHIGDFPPRDRSRRMHESVSAADSGFAGGPLQKAHQPMSEWSTMTPNDQLEARIKELGDKSTQILIFHSFALVVVATLRSNPALGLEQKTALVAAMRWWMRAVWPVLLGIVPLKEFRENSRTWYRIVRITKVVLLWLAAIFILLGLYRFAYGI